MTSSSWSIGTKYKAAFLSSTAIQPCHDNKVVHQPASMKNKSINPR
jgi:hypothetical protein